MTSQQLLAKTLELDLLIHCFVFTFKHLKCGRRRVRCCWTPEAGCCVPPPGISWQWGSGDSRASGSWANCSVCLITLEWSLQQSDMKFLYARSLSGFPNYGIWPYGLCFWWFWANASLRDLHRLALDYLQSQPQLSPGSERDQTRTLQTWVKHTVPKACYAVTCGFFLWESGLSCVIPPDCGLSARADGEWGESTMSAMAFFSRVQF